MKKNQIALIIICPDCGNQIKIWVEKSAYVSIGDAGKQTSTSDRPDGGTRGESQEEYLGG